MTNKKRELETLDKEQLEQVIGGNGTQPVPWIVKKPVTPQHSPLPLPW